MSTEYRLRTSQVGGLAALQARHGKRRYYPYTDRFGREFHFRSGPKYELGVARILDERGLTWEYEARTITLDHGRRYVPDFWVAEWCAFLEVKGWPGLGLDKVEAARTLSHKVLLVRSLADLPEH